jgi:prepilin-type N-terminal cleavage/methylation domain-containing protein
MKNTKSNQEGFTLVELLVSMALLSLMAIYSVQALRTLHNMNRVEVDISKQMEVDAVARHLRSEISDARAVFLQSDTPNAKLAFSGMSHSLSFVTAANGEREVGGLYLIIVDVGTDGTLKSSRQMLSAHTSNPIDEVTLLRGVKSVNFAYINANNSSEILQNWTIDNELPDAIRVNVVFENGDLRNWMDLLITIETAG